ncbi:hypothetical protein L9F63_017074, partial [Diploptera punctata]
LRVPTSISQHAVSIESDGRITCDCSAPLRVRLLSRCRLPTAEHQGRPSSAS